MTTFERFERDIPELMTELAPAQVPDYFDDMLRQTASKRQRPAWSYPERWLPMGVIARTAPIRTISWRPIAVLALLMLLIAAALFAYAGSGPKLPSPFGLARNGQIVFSDATGTIQAADPSAGTYATLVAGSETSLDPAFTNDGTQFAFARGTESARGLFIANADGSGVRQVLAPDLEINWFRWSPTGDRNRPVSIRGRARHDHDRASRRRLIPNAAPWRQCPRCDVAPDRDELLVTADTTTTSGATEHGFYVVGANGAGLRPIVVAAPTVNTPTVAPDGATLAYATWETGAEGRIHLVDIESGIDKGVDFSPNYPFTDLTRASLRMGPSCSLSGTRTPPTSSRSWRRTAAGRSSLSGRCIRRAPTGRGSVLPGRHQSAGHVSG